MPTIWTIVEEAGGRNAAASVRIENPPFQRLVIEMLPECGPDGHRAISIAHYGESIGDLMRDPEGNLNRFPGETRAIEEFLAMWDRNLREQGYLEAFRRTRPPAGGGR